MCENFLPVPLEPEVYTEEGFCDLRFGRLHGETAFGTFFMRLTYPIGGAAAYLSLADRSAVSAHDLAGERVGSTGSRRNESAFSGYPHLEFNGTKANCSVTILGERTTDKISATMELWQGNTLIDDWSASGSGILKMDKTTAVEKNKTYMLTVEYAINGVAQKTVSVSGTNR